MKSSRGDTSIKYLSLLIYPWVSLFYSLRSLNTRSTFFVIFVFSVLFGLAFTPDLNSKLDSARYLEYFHLNSNLTLAEYYRDLVSYFNFEEGRKDFFMHTMTFLVSSFTHNYHFLFATFAAVFSLFFLKSFKYFTFNAAFDNKNALCLMLALMFALSNPIFNINGVRFWTASWFAIYLLFKIVIEDKKSFLLLGLLLPIIHAAFWIFFFFIFIYYLVRNNKILIVSFFVSFAISGFMITFVKDLSQILPSTLSRLIEIYTSEDYMSYRNELTGNVNWYISLLNTLKTIYPNFLIYFIIRSRNNTSNPIFHKILALTLIIAIFSNLTISIPSLGNRFQMLLFPFISLLWLLNINSLRRFKYLIYCFPIAWIVDIRLMVEWTIDLIDPYFYISPTPYFIYHIITI